MIAKAEEYYSANRGGSKRSTQISYPVAGGSATIRSLDREVIMPQTRHQAALRIAPRLAVMALGLGLVVAKPPLSRAQQDRDLLPRLGETSAEYEARIKGLPPPARPAVPSKKTFTADAGGHFFVDVMVNGSRVHMMVDTGATIVALSRDDARRAGITPQPSDFKARVSTANGIVPVAPVMLKDIAIGEVAVRDVPAVVFPDNRLQVGLLGMSFLSRLSHVEVSGGRLLLQQ
jgi:aspartyl protease family protein